MGRFVNDPELRSTNDGKKVCSFTIACDRDRQKEATDYFDCVAWNATAEFVCKYFFKGKQALVSGPFQSRKWQDKNGNNRLNWEILVQDIYFADEKRRDSGPDVIARDFAEYSGNEEIPF